MKENIEIEIQGASNEPIQSFGNNTISSRELIFNQTPKPPIIQVGLESNQITLDHIKQALILTKSHFQAGDEGVGIPIQFKHGKNILNVQLFNPPSQVDPITTLTTQFISDKNIQQASFTDLQRMFSLEMNQEVEKIKDFKISDDLRAIFTHNPLQQTPLPQTIVQGTASTPPPQEQQVITPSKQESSFISRIWNMSATTIMKFMGYRENSQGDQFTISDPSNFKKTTQDDIAHLTSAQISAQPHSSKRQWSQGIEPRSSTIANINPSNQTHVEKSATSQSQHRGHGVQ